MGWGAGKTTDRWEGCHKLFSAYVLYILGTGTWIDRLCHIGLWTAYTLRHCTACTAFALYFCAQVDMSVTRKYGGTGLGLNIVKQLVTAHDGTISCESEEGRGTVFTITLPVMQRNTRPSLELQVCFRCVFVLCWHVCA